MTSFNLSNEEKSLLLDAAKNASKNAYAPYSRFCVGAAILTNTGKIFTGCNVENASYGLTICAERAAIFSAVAKVGGENLKIRAVAVVNQQGIYCPPCGACRQVIFEFGVDALILIGEGSNWKQVTINDLLPEAFKLK
jgi:cytidine deaminase